MNNKISTSIQYQISNVVLFDSIYSDWKNFNEILNNGPGAMKKYLFDMWNKLKDDLKNDEKLIIKDLDKEVSLSDFDVTFNKTKNGTPIFFITFPDYDYKDGASKYVALALVHGMPRYFTLEYSEHIADNSPCWVVGEFVLDLDIKDIKHINYTTVDNMRLTWFAGFIMGLLESKNL